MTIAPVRSLRSGRIARTPQELEDFEQELVDQFCLALMSMGLADRHVAAKRAVVFAFIGFLGKPVWAAEPTDADRFLAMLRRDQSAARETLRQKALSLSHFFEFLITRHQGDISEITGFVVEQIIDEFNRPAKSDFVGVRIPPSVDEVAQLFDGWRDSLESTRKYLPAARDYMAASLWRRLGLRINESVMLDIGDWRPDLGEHGKFHVRHGKGNHGKGPKPRLIPAINAADDLVVWWLEEVRHQFGSDWQDPNAPMFPSERHDPLMPCCARVGPDALRSGLAAATKAWLPDWAGKLTPHGLRHFCASSLYERGVDLKAIQDLLGHEWLSTTTRYIHVHDNHIETAWAHSNERVGKRFNSKVR